MRMSMAAMRRYLQAQSLMEYVLLLTIIVAALIYMYPRVKRSTQSLMKTAADQIGDQAGAEQDFNKDMTGYIVGANTFSNVVINNLRRDVWGVIDRTINETTTTRESTLTNSGFSKD